MNGLIGYTGFVGQNLDDPLFDFRFNSKNSTEMEGKNFDLLVCAGVPSHKTLANKFPERDWESVSGLMASLSRVRCAKMVLISTIDVLPAGGGKYEDTQLCENGMPPYGLHRLKMEQFVQENFDDVTIIRLPGVFGKGLRKNFIFDLIFQIPRMFSEQEFLDLRSCVSQKEIVLLDDCYERDQNRMFLLRMNLKEDSLGRLRGIMETHQCTSLRFTDSRNLYAYYDLNLLKDDLQRILRHNIALIHMAAEPITAAELAERAFHITFSNEDRAKPPTVSYVKSRYASLWGGANGYLYSKNQIVEQLLKFDKTSILF